MFVTTLLSALAFVFSPPRATEVMVLGTFHFANPGLDLVNAKIDDVLAEKRQAEIREIVEALARFRPTKIVLEYPASHDDKYNAQYRAYLEGKRELTRNEHDQIGMRLAERLGHARLYGVDENQDLDFEGALAAGVQAGQQELVARIGAEIEAIRKRIGTMQGPGIPLAKSLRAHNDPSVDGQGLYHLLAAVGTAENPAGARLVSNWYRRNALIFANILRLIDGEDERILVLYGSGHRDLLVGFVKKHPDLKLVSPLDYLPQ